MVLRTMPWLSSARTVPCVSAKGRGDIYISNVKRYLTSPSPLDALVDDAQAPVSGPLATVLPCGDVDYGASGLIRGVSFSMRLQHTLVSAQYGSSIIIAVAWFDYDLSWLNAHCSGSFPWLAFICKWSRFQSAF